MSYQALLFCPDDKTAKLVTQVLSELDFSVEPSNEPFNAVKRLMAQHFDAVVVDCDNEQNATLLFKSARNSASNQSSLAVAVVEGQAGVAKAFRIGANLVLTKPINVDQAKGTLRVARGLLKKGDPNKAAANAPVAASTPAPAFTPAKPAPPAPAATPRPSFTPVAPKAVPVPPSAPQYAQAHASAATTSHAAAEHEVHESAVLDLPPDLAPSAKSPAVRPAAKEYAWQPVSKPTGPMANAFKQAEPQDTAEVDEILDEAVEAPEAETSTAPPAFSMPVSTASAASAPAPAKQKVAVKAVARKVIKPAAVPAEKLPDDKHDHKAAPAAIKLSISDPSAEEPATAHVAAAHAPVPFSAPQKSGSNTGLIAAAVILVLAAGGYFGWTKLHSSSSPAPAQQASVTQPATSAAPTAVAPTTAPSESKPSAGSVAPAVSHTETAATAPKPSAESEKKAPASKSASSSKQEDEDNSDADNAEPAAPQPMIVKSGTGQKVQTAPAPSAPVVAPNAVLGSAGSSANMNAIASTGLSVAKPVEQTLRVSQGVLQGRLIKKVQPVYPSVSLRLRVQGVVQLAATISKDGSVTNVKQVSGDPNLGHAAEDAVRQWKYKPYMLDGRPVEIQTQISVDFKLPN